MAALGIVDPLLRAEMMQLYLQLDAYPEAAPTLARLKGAGMRTAILSNGSSTMLAAAVATGKLREYLDVIVSVDEVAIYKPHPSVYGHAAERLGVAAGRTAFFSSNGWDAHGAQSFGFHAVWVNRASLKPDGLPSSPEIQIRTLAEAPALFGL
jgi:2-haloacid dehalogenase